MGDRHYSVEGNWTLVPEHLREGIEGHIATGREVGSFLTALLSNDLRDAVCRADDVNRLRLRDIVVFLVNDAPADCWGSPEKVAAWRERGGLAGISEPARALTLVETGIGAA